MNLPYDELLKLFENNKIGIHTMEAEHFGIAIVEMIVSKKKKKKKIKNIFRKIF